MSKLTPVIGTEIRGLQLSQLNDTQKNELALLIAERGVVIFRDQDFKDIGPEKQKEFARYFGPLHIHVSNNFSELDDVAILTQSHSPLELMLRAISSITTSILAQTTNIELGSEEKGSPPRDIIPTSHTSISPLASRFSLFSLSRRPVVTQRGHRRLRHTRACHNPLRPSSRVCALSTAVTTRQRMPDVMEGMFVASL